MNNLTHPAPDAGTRTGPSAEKQVIVLVGRYSFSQDFMNSVREQVEFVLPVLERDEAYTLEELCGPEYWGRLSDGECKMAGRAMAHMVVKGLLPLEFAKAKHEFPKHYRLK